MTPQIILTPKQAEARALAQGSARFILFRGGSRSGKTFAICFFILMRAMLTPGSRHAIFRNTAVDVRRTLFDLTFKAMMETAFPGLWAELKDKRLINDTEMTIEVPCPGGGTSLIVFMGLDEQDRILGQEFSTAYINECTNLKTFNVVQTVMSRLSLEVPQANGKPLKPKLFFDCNPTGKRHWTFKAFMEKANPLSGELWPRPEEWAEIHMNPEDNAGNISSTYLDDLQNLSSRDRQRFLRGEWQNDNDNALFDPSWIADNRLPARDPADVESLTRIVVAVDPAVSSDAGSDEHGIIVAGVDEDGHVHILEDCSTRGEPQKCAERAIKAYEDWQADTIVVERNNGGEWLPSTFRLINASIPVGTVWASRGKIIRAEPVSALYEQNRIHHNGTFEKLEGQLEDFTIDYNRRKNGSPDRLDALVWAVTELAVDEKVDRGGGMTRVNDFWR